MKMARDDMYYAAYVARDARFDGVFFMGVTSTGIYCRPVCTAKTPKRENCRFFEEREMAEGAGFRPCKRCRPELARGLAPVDDAKRISSQLVQRMMDGVIAEDAGLEEMAGQFELSTRQLRRIVRRELGVTPIELIQKHRLARAKRLLDDTRLRVTEIAFASGFGSLRRFNDAFKAHYGLSPRQLRKEEGVTR